MGWGGNMEPSYDIPTLISDNSDKVKFINILKLFSIELISLPLNFLE